jgi:hypothetical protein
MKDRSPVHAARCMEDLRIQYAAVAEVPGKEAFRMGLWTAAFLLGVDLDEVPSGTPS